MARPVAIIRSSDLTMVSSPPTPLTPPSTNLSSPHQDHQDAQQQQHQTHMSENNHSPPESPQAQMERKGLSRISSPYATSRDYAFNHFHSQQPQVRNFKTFQWFSRLNFMQYSAFQLSLINLNNVGRDKSNKLESLLITSHDTQNNTKNSLEQPLPHGRGLWHDVTSSLK